MFRSGEYLYPFSLLLLLTFAHLISREALESVRESKVPSKELTLLIHRLDSSLVNWEQQLCTHSSHKACASQVRVLACYFWCSTAPKRFGGVESLKIIQRRLWMTQAKLWSVVGDSPSRSGKESARREHLVLARTKGERYPCAGAPTRTRGSVDSSTPRQNVDESILAFSPPSFTFKHYILANHLFLAMLAMISC
jgi:hypothetical protein